MSPLCPLWFPTTTFLMCRTHVTTAHLLLLHLPATLCSPPQTICLHLILLSSVMSSFAILMTFCIFIAYLLHNSCVISPDVTKMPFRDWKISSTLFGSTVSARVQTFSAALWSLLSKSFWAKIFNSATISKPYTAAGRTSFLPFHSYCCPSVIQHYDTSLHPLHPHPIWSHLPSLLPLLLAFSPVSLSHQSRSHQCSFHFLRLQDLSWVLMQAKPNCQFNHLWDVNRSCTTFISTHGDI